MSANQYIKILQNTAACVDRQGEYLGTQGYDRKFDLVEDVLVIIQDPVEQITVQVFVADKKVFDASVSSDNELALFTFISGEWVALLEQFADRNPPNNPTSFSNLSNLRIVDYR